MLFAHNTSRVADEPYPRLLSEKGFNGFPALCFMDADGNVLVKQGDRTVGGFEKTRDRLQALDGLRKAAVEGGAEAHKALFFAELELGMVATPAIKQRVDELHLEADDRARADLYLVDAEVRDLRARSRELGAAAVNEAIVAMAKAGRRPSPESAPIFWHTTLSWCSKQGEPQLAQSAFDELSKLALPEAMKKRMQALLEQAQAAGKDKDQDKK